MTRNDTTCPRCNHTFTPEKPAPDAPLMDLLERFHAHADGAPRLSSELHAEFIAWAIADGQPPTFTASQKWVTVRLLRVFGWGWKNSGSGRRYFPPGNRSHAGSTDAARLEALLAEFVDVPVYRRPASATQLQSDFLSYARGRGLPAGVVVAVPWVSGRLSSVHGWERRHTSAGRLIFPPA